MLEQIGGDTGVSIQLIIGIGTTLLGAVAGISGTLALLHEHRRRNDRRWDDHDTWQTTVDAELDRVRVDRAVQLDRETRDRDTRSGESTARGTRQKGSK